MKKITLNIIVAVVLLSSFIAAYIYFKPQQSKPEDVQTQEQTPPLALPELPEPLIRQVLIDSSKNIELPPLETSDGFMLNALASLVKNQSLMQIFHAEQLIHNIVATIDNLPRQRAPMRVMPVEAANEKFLIIESNGTIAINPKNNFRYSPYVRFAIELDAKKLVALYIQLYPLFQQSYEELGYPNQYFNDRLIVVINDLLATPDINEPIQIIQPKYYYLYADPDFESRSIGQKILMRIGSNNEMVIKTKLKEIKQELTLHMH